MSKEYWIGVVAGLIGFSVVFFLFYFLFRMINKNNHPEIKGKKRYDERQLVAQGVAYKWAFWTVAGYEAIYGILNTYMSKVDAFAFFNQPLNGLLGIFLGVTVYGIVCVVKDAYMSMYENPKTVTVTLGIVALANLLPSISVMKKGLIVNGVWNLNLINLYAAVALLVVLAAFWIKLAMNKIDEEEE